MIKLSPIFLKSYILKNELQNIENSAKVVKIMSAEFKEMSALCGSTLQEFENKIESWSKKQLNDKKTVK